jgi:AAA+ superfamily predicted ATPase
MRFLNSPDRRGSVPIGWQNASVADDPLLTSLIAAVTANPGDVALRLHVAGMLLERGRPTEALEHCATVLRADPGHREALAMLGRATAALRGPGGPVGPVGPRANPEADFDWQAAEEQVRDVSPPPPFLTGDPFPGDAPRTEPFREPHHGEPHHGEPHRGDPQYRDQQHRDPQYRDPRPGDQPPGQYPPPGGYPADQYRTDPYRTEAFRTDQYRDGEEPGVDEYRTRARAHDDTDQMQPVFDGPELGLPPLDIERPSVRLADVGGLAQVKERLEAAFLGPMRNPAMARMFGKSLRGGLLLYGPPGCGKTFVARAVAGELGARFTTVSLADVLGQWMGETERNLQQLFRSARQHAPCVLFLDEVDAIGHRRSRIGSGWTGLRSAVNQLLLEMDSAGADNDGVFVLAATNSPWDVDPALRRPGRFDRTVLVLPPDGPARAAILRYHLQHRPLAGIELDRLVKRTDGFSGADLAHLCDTAAEVALGESMRTGTARPMRMSDFAAALKQVRPSTGPWLESARSVAVFGNNGGEYDELAAYLKAKRLL